MGSSAAVLMKLKKKKMLSFAGVLLGCLMNKMLEDAWQRQFV
jgi:hypothetical protein